MIVFGTVISMNFFDLLLILCIVFCVIYDISACVALPQIHFTSVLSLSTLCVNLFSLQVMSNGTLIVRNASISNEGDFMCQASNDMGTAVKSTKLRVHSKLS